MRKYINNHPELALALLIVAGITLGSVVGCGNGDANMHARQWAERHYPDTTQSVECIEGGIMGDSDSDGYVSCTVFRTDGDPIPLACGTDYVGCGQKGCKIRYGK